MFIEKVGLPQTLLGFRATNRKETQPIQAKSQCRRGEAAALRHSAVGFLW